MNEKRLGRQMPTVGFTLPYTVTDGHSAIEIYERSGRTAQDWQKNLIYDMLARNDEGLWTHSRFGYSVPRQNGKNEVIAIRELYGLFHGERMLHTAHRTMTSRAAWERLTMLLDSMEIYEQKGDIKVGYKSGKGRGQEWIQLHDDLGGGKISFRTRSATGGLGETFDLLVIDEAQEYQDDQESALKYTIVSSDNPQTILLGTPPTPYSSGTIFPNLRMQILCGEKKHAGWAEWSVEKDTDPRDIDAWYETNPSLGYKLTERAIEDEIGGDRTDFNIQRLGLWIRYNQQSLINKNEWNAMETNALPALTGLMCIGVKFSKDGSSVSMSVAVKTKDECTFHETIACKPMRDGIDWIVHFLRCAEGNYNKLIIDGANGSTMLEDALKDARLPAPYKITAREYIDANAKFLDDVYQKRLVHMSQPSVEQIATNCEKRAIGTSGGFGFKALNISHDVSIIDSIVLACWGLGVFKSVPHRQRISY